jgi:hypothetical protein
MTLITNNNEFWIKEKPTKYTFILCLVVCTLSFTTKMQQFQWTMKANYVLPHVPYFNYLKYNLKKSRSNLYVWMVLDYDMWHNENVTCDMLIIFFPIDLGG